MRETEMIADEIEKLKRLHDAGTLTAEEFERAKARLLGDGPGAAAGNRAGSMGESAAAAINQFRLSNTDRWLGGVCGGLAALTGIENWIWRLIWVALLFAGGFGFFLYVLLWIFVPRAE
jgi:phage shock protein PspC (stress-responsive transcriptional regulator)